MQPTRKLRPLKTVAEAYRFFFGHLDLVARMCSGWLGVATVLLVLSVALFAQVMDSDAPAAMRLQAMPRDAQVAAIIGLPMLVLFIAAPLFVVTWHRVIIKQAKPRIFPFPLGGALLYVARTILLGLIWPLTVALLGLLPIIYVGKLAIDPNFVFALKLGLVAIAALIGIIITARLLLVLPAGAVGDWSINLAKSWQMTTGNGLRLGAGFILAAAPVFAIEAATRIFFRAIEDQAVATRAAVFVLVVSTLLSLAAALIEASFLSFAYLFFVGEERA